MVPSYDGRTMIRRRRRPPATSEFTGRPGENVMNGVDRLCDARVELLEGDGDERERLLRAARDFLSAAEKSRGWPADVRRRAEPLLAAFLRHGGPEESVARMTEETLRQVSDELWRFSEVAEPCPSDAAGAKVRGIEHLREARAALDADGAVRDKVRAAARRLREAVRHAGPWPDGLRVRAEALSARIFRHGGRDGGPAGERQGLAGGGEVRRMRDESAAEISTELLGLCDDAEDFESDGPHRRKPH